MLLRLILSLVLGTLGCQPVAAMPCHDSAAMTMTMAMPAHAATPAERHHDAAPAHACLGCIPPATLRSGVMPAPAADRNAPFAPGRVAHMPGGAILPGLPPPRA